MQSTMFALLDCNNFYVSCERVFNPKLTNKPVVVLSNNDGCVISRSNEAKKMGVAMGEPMFKITALVKKYNINVLSSNFSLYGDLSSRVMSIVMNSMPDVSIYSIDEAFINLSSMHPNYDAFEESKKLVAKIEQYTGIPVSIGIATTKTLAKLANQIAKKSNLAGRVLCLDSKPKLDEALQKFPIGDVWGIGKQTNQKLNKIGVFTAADLARLSGQAASKSFNLLLQRTIAELNGNSCISHSGNSANRKQIMVSRSFGHRVTELDKLQEAISTYASLATEKLRKQNSVAGGFHVFMHTGLHNKAGTVYQNSTYVPLPTPTSYTPMVVSKAKAAINAMFREGYRYQKVGIILSDLCAATSRQIDLFGDSNLEKEEKLVSIVDSINQRFGKESLQFASNGLHKDWRNISERRSKLYTTNWDELPIAKS